MSVEPMRVRGLTLGLVVASAHLGACRSDLPRAVREAPVASLPIGGCDAEQAMQAQDAGATPRTWRELYDRFVLFGGCDEGPNAERFSEAVSYVLVEQWIALPDLAAQMAMDPAFEGFVLRHVDAAIPKKRLETIVTLSRTLCPAAQTALCSRLETAARRALSQAPQAFGQGSPSENVEG